MQDSKCFERERRTLLAILIIFDLSFILRATYNEIYVRSEFAYFTACLTNILSGSIFDLLPISLILFIHNHNFKTIPQGLDLKEQSVEIDGDINMLLETETIINFTLPDNDSINYEDAKDSNHRNADQLVISETANVESFDF